MGSKPVKKSAPQNAPYLEQLLGANKGRLYDLPMDIISIGRAPDNDIVFPSEAVSRCHAFLKKTAAGWLLLDNQSKNGVKRNGDKVVEAALKNGDVVQVGDFVFRFIDPSQPALSPDPPRSRRSQTHTGTAPYTNGGPGSRTVPGASPYGSSGTQAFVYGPSANPTPIPLSTPTSPARTPITPVTMEVEAPALDNAFSKPSGGGSMLQFGLGMAALVILSVLIGFRLRNRIGHLVDTARSVADTTGNRTPANTRVKAPPGPQAARPPLKPSAAPQAGVPIDQNNPNEGRVVAEEVIDPGAPPPPPIPENARGGPSPAPAEELTKRDLQFHPGKNGARNIKKDLGVYLQEGRDYLKEGDFESAALAFRFALVIDPNNHTAIEGIRAAEYRRRDIPVESAAGPEPSRKEQVRGLLKSARDALSKRSYQEAINLGERVRHIEIPGETAYLNEAKQIIDRAKLKQKEDFDPFMQRAREKLKAGDYQGSRALCEEMLRTDPAYNEAKECLALANQGLKGKGLQ